MSPAIWGLFKSVAPLFPSTIRHFSPPDTPARHIEPSAFTRPWSIRLCADAPVARSHAKPLRVTRLVDQSCGAQYAGRMVMSGRFEDVCAELDRLVAMESAREATRTCS